MREWLVTVIFGVVFYFIYSFCKDAHIRYLEKKEIKKL